MLVSDLLDRCTAHELHEWSAFMAITPDDLVPKKGIDEQFFEAIGKRKNV